MVSRVLGLVRDVVIARVFGVSTATEAFFVANKIPNMLRRFFAEGAFAQAFVPVVNEYKEKHGHEATAALVGKSLGTLAGVLLVVSLIGVIAAPALVWVFAPGFSADARFDLTSQMLRFTFPYILFVSLTALAGSVLNSFGRFAAPAVTPALLNVSLIVAAFWLAPQLQEPGLALAIAVLVGGVVQLAFLLPFMATLGLLKRPRFAWGDVGVAKIRRLMVPALFGSSVAQINMLIDTLIASVLVSGSVSWLYYSDRLMEFPLGVFGIALATVILPRLSSQHVNADSTAFGATLWAGIRLVLVVGVPAALGLAVLAGPLIQTLFHYGAFTETDVAMARYSLCAFAAGLPAFMLVKILAPGFYARQDTKTPVKFAIAALVVNLILNVAFVFGLRQLNIAGEHAGLAAATSVAAAFNAWLLFAALRRTGRLPASTGKTKFAIQLAVSAAMMTVVLVVLSSGTADWSIWGASQRAARLAGLVIVGAGSYIAMLWMCGLRPRDVLPAGQP